MSRGRRYWRALALERAHEVLLLLERLARQQSQSLEVLALERKLAVARALIERLMADAWAVLREEVEARFSPDRLPTENERHLLNLLSWREQENAALRAELLASREGRKSG